MTLRPRVVFVVAAIALAVVVMVVPEPDTRGIESNTHGTMPWGYRAVHDLLVELGFPVVRHDESPRRLPTTATAWWVARRSTCPEYSTAERSRAAGDWVTAGGTAVVFLPPTAAGPLCIEGTFAVPDRTPGGKATRAEIDGLGDGPKRALDINGLMTFDTAGDWIVRATRTTRPLVLEQVLGKGRVVAVADERLLYNSNLATADTAPLVVDLVRVYGPPVFVERTSPFAAMHTTPILYLARSSAAALLAGLLLTGILVAWRGGLVPARTIDRPEVPAPTLDVFVDSLARLYAGTQDHVRVLLRYRELVAGRLRRHLRMPPHTPLETVVARLETTRPAVRALLLAPPEVPTPAELRAMVARLDAFAHEVIG